MGEICTIVTPQMFLTSRKRHRMLLVQDQAMARELTTTSPPGQTSTECRSAEASREACNLALPCTGEKPHMENK